MQQFLVAIFLHMEHMFVAGLNSIDRYFPTCLFMLLAGRYVEASRLLLHLHFNIIYKNMIFGYSIQVLQYLHINSQTSSATAEIVDGPYGASTLS